MTTIPTNNEMRECFVPTDNDVGVFYGLFIPEEEKGVDGLNSVYTEKEKVLCLVKKFKNSRFKAFRSYHDAFLFASGDPPYSPPLICQPADSNENKLENLDGTSKFKGPKPQDLTKLRRAIEKGDKDFFVTTVWANPYYLISSGDTPAILQEGCRYNALHVAAKSQQTEMVTLILETIENPKFLKLLFGDEDEEACLQRMHFLVDSYFNMPDKGCFETPLHFAAKFGSAAIVKILTAHPLCEIERKNKFGETPKEIICSRCSSPTSALKEEIENYFHLQYCVPVLYREDNSVQAVLMKPLPFNRTFSPDSNSRIYSPIMASMKVRAYAGPMIFAKAEEFYKKFKKFSSTDDSNLRTTGLCDYEKGLERVGRQLAKEMNVPWIEYWPCLSCYCDITSKEGLKHLEAFFQRKFNSLKNDDEDNDSNLSGNSMGLSSLCEAVQNYSFNTNIEDPLSNSSDEEYVTPPSSPSSSFYGSACSLEQINNSDCMLFVEGFHPTKSDMDILRAIENVEINENEYPLTWQWKNNILSFPKEVCNMWPSPYSPRCHSTPVLSRSLPRLNFDECLLLKRSYSNESPVPQRILASTKRSLLKCFLQPSGLDDNA